MVWGKNGTPDTLTSAGDTMTISDLTANKFNQFMIHTLRTGTGTSHNKRWLTTLDNNSATDYAWRRSANGGTDATSVSQANIDFCDATEDESEEFGVIYGVNIDGEEKLFIMPQRVYAFVTGASNAPGRVEMVAKCDTTTNTGQYTRIDVNNDLAGSYDTGSNLSALGSEMTPTAAITFPTNVQVGSRAEITDTRKMYNYVVPSITLQDDFSSDNWVGGDSKNIVSGGSLNFDMRRDGSNDSATRDITSLSVSDEKWVLRFKLNFTVANTGGNGNRFYFGLSSSANTVGQNTAQDAIMLYQNHDVDDKVGACDADGAVLPQVNTTTVSYATGTDYYCEIARTSTTTYTVKMWTGSYGGTEFANESGTCSATLAGLKYIKISNHDASNISTWNELTGTIDDIEFYNGVSQTTSFWQEIGA